MKKTLFSLIACTAALSSCATEKVATTEEAPVKPVEKPRAPAVPAPPPAPTPIAADDNGGFRLPDLLAMPDEAQLRSAPGPPSSSNTGVDGTITAQPPKE